jgi:hypothetical protein
MMTFRALQNVYVELPEDNAMPETSTYQTLPGGKPFVGRLSGVALRRL